MDPRSREGLREDFGLSPEDRMLLVLGGSQGAHGINEMLAHEGRRLSDAGWKILWQSGEKEFGLRRTQSAGNDSIRVEAFLHDVYAALKAADLCVSRSGAGAVAELALHHLPTLFVPYPHATDNHQETNARELEEAGAGYVLTERAYGEGLLSRNIEALWSRRESAAKAMERFSRPDAAATIAHRIATDLGAKA
jgi:UDP-N-acetylglucosamine--N-acetylmuramyl-(pentapeptide) pyrophosphoryl-undecaprenol N-acetylglucosamine transferase